MKKTIEFYIALVVLIESEGAKLPGLTSLEKCNEYYNLSFPTDNYFLLTMEDLDKLNEMEFNYIRAYTVVYGGVRALPNQLPFMAAIGYIDGNEKKFVCGGTLISEHFVLTAAHCIFTRTQIIEFIRLGDLNLTSSADNVAAQEFQLAEYFVHPSYKYPYKYDDIALIKLDKSAVFTSSVAPACLEPKRVDIRFQDFYVAGWGRLGFGEDVSDHLQVAKLEHYNTKKCLKFFPSDYTLPESIKPESQICAIGRVNLTDTCEGDSGGPLVYKYNPSPKRVIYYIAGVTSFGKSCALGEIPGIYTRVSHYTDWIENIVWSNNNKDDISGREDDEKIHFP